MKKHTLWKASGKAAAWTLAAAMTLGSMSLPALAEPAEEEAVTAQEAAAVDISKIDASKITVVKTTYDLENALGDANSGDVVQLGANITVSYYDWFYAPSCFYGILDGNGFTITIDDAEPILKSVDSGAVIQNLGIKGVVDMDEDDECGTICRTLYGKMINCYSTATVKNPGEDCGGLVGITNGNTALISNCYYAGSVQNAGSNEVGALAGGLYKGTVCENSFWVTTNDLKTAAPTNYIDMSNCSAKSAVTAAIMNANKGTGCMNWEDVQDGTPILVKAKNPVFTADGSDKKVEITDGVLELPLEEITRYVAGTGIAGTLTIANFTGEVIWLLAPEYYDIYKVMPIGVGKYSGELYVKYAAEAEIIAYDKATCDQFGEPLADGSSKELARIQVVVTDPANIDEIRMLAGDQVLTDGAECQIGGSEWVELIPQVHDSVTDTWKTLGPGAFEFPESDDECTYMAMRNSYRSKGGDFTITITGYEKSCTIHFKSSYVPVAGIAPAFDRIYTIHGRDSSGRFPALTSGTLNNSVKVVPENASYAYEWEMTSSNEAVAEVIPGVSVRPVSAGTAVITAETKDPKATKQVSGKKSVTFRYLNPVTEVKLVTPLDEDQEYPVQLDEGDTDIPLLLLFEGELENYHVTEAGMVWTYSEEGVCRIYRQSEVMEIINDDTNFNETEEDAQYVSSDKYYVEGLKKGIVTVTGTPVDSTNGAEPVVFKVCVGIEDPAEYEETQEILSRFDDVSEDAWYAESVANACRLGIMKGTGENTFKPVATMTRAEFAQVIYNLLGEETEEVKQVFPDVPVNAWYAKAVQKVNEKGIINGYQNKTFGPANPVTREQIAVMLYKFAEVQGYDTEQRADLDTFLDVDRVTYGKEAMAWAVASGIIKGAENGTKLNPTGNATRAEVATMMVNFVQTFAE